MPSYVPDLSTLSRPTDTDPADVGAAEIRLLKAAVKTLLDWKTAVGANVDTIPALTATVASHGTQLTTLASSVGAGNFVTGDVKLGFYAVAPTGWALWKTGSIGNATSNSTIRANADCEALFTFLWNMFPQAICEIQDTTGSAVARAGTAAGDWALSRRIMLPTADNNSLRLAGSNYALGSSGGSDSVSLTINNIPAHTHTTNVLDTQQKSGVTTLYNAVNKTLAGARLTSLPWAKSAVMNNDMARMNFADDGRFPDYTSYKTKVVPGLYLGINTLQLSTPIGTYQEISDDNMAPLSVDFGTAVAISGAALAPVKNLEFSNYKAYPMSYGDSVVGYSISIPGVFTPNGCTQVTYEPVHSLTINSVIYGTKEVTINNNAGKATVDPVPTAPKYVTVSGIIKL